MAQIQSVGIAGFGTMGSGIAEVIARAGIPVKGYVPDDRAVAIGHARLEYSTQRAVDGAKMTADERDALIGLISVGTDPNALADVDLLIEAVPVVLEL